MSSSSVNRLAPVLLAIAGCGSSTKPAASTPTASAEQPAVVVAGATDPGGAELASIETAPPAPEPTPMPELVRVTVLSAEIAGTMPNGEEWDARAPAGDHIDPPLGAYFEQHPELVLTVATLGVPIDAPGVEKEAGKSKAADPMVLIEAGPRVFRSPMRPRAFSPAWSFAFEVVVDPAPPGGGSDASRGLPGAALVRLHVVDYDSPTRFDTIGTTVLTVEELLAKPIHRIGPFGGVTSLVVQVDRAPLVDEPVVHRLAVQGNAPWTDTAIDVVAGQRIVIEAADEVCTSGSDLSRCAGPEGQRKTSEYNLPGFAWLGHGALVGSIGDTRFAVKRRLELVAPASGRLRLGVNDRSGADNKGAFAVRVTIAPAQ